MRRMVRVTISQMRKNMRKLTGLILGACMLAGCSSSDGTAASGSASASAETVYPQVTITSPIEITIKDENPDLSGYQFFEDPDPVLKEITFTEATRLIEEGGSGLILYSATWCPFCQRAIPQVNYVAKQMGVTVYYVCLNNDAEHAVSTEELNELCRNLDWIEWEKDEANPDGAELPNFQIPLFLGVKNGEITGHHLSLVDSFSLVDENSQMNSDQIAELRGIYAQIIEDTAD